MKRQPICNLKAVAFAFFAMMLTGCGSSSSHLSESGVREQIKFAVMGGNATCHNDEFGNPRSPIGNDLYNSFQNVLADVNAEQNYDATWVVSCHRNGNSTVYYTTSDADNQVFEAAQDQFIQIITGDFLATDTRKVFLAGHSYGGWLTMKAAIAAAPDHSFAGVYTIDPISRVNCTFINPVGCTSAPEDISHDERLEIAEKSEFWGNYFQTNTFYLHSGPMEEADENIQRNDSHTTIDNDQFVWDRIRDTVKIQLANNGAGNT